MTRKGNLTRERIIREAAVVLNERGYFGMSITDVMNRTQLEKGGIYNHFDNKEALALAAFEYAAAEHDRHLQRIASGAGSASARLIAIGEACYDVLDNPDMPGGCPLLNGSVEASSRLPALRDSVRAALDRFCTLIQQVIAQGIADGEIRRDVDIAGVGTVAIALFEGGILLSRLHGDPLHLRRVLDHWRIMVETQLRA